MGFSKKGNYNLGIVPLLSSNLIRIGCRFRSVALGRGWRRVVQERPVESGSGDISCLSPFVLISVIVLIFFSVEIIRLVRHECANPDPRQAHPLTDRMRFPSSG